MRLTKLKLEYIDLLISKNGYVAFQTDIFKSEEYKQWKKERKTKLK
jgi:hypothetical protein